MGLNIEDLIESNDAMTEAIQRVRELHGRKDWDVCPVCIVWNEEQLDYVGYSNPCPTIKALDGEQ